jgi:2-amino-4-hydroxy-6-hydroxymethyldihydropteridine diphosphokinase
MSAPRPHWWPVYVGLGSNLDDPVAQVERALRELAELPRCHFGLASSLYRSAPLGPPDQPDYYNAVAGLLTQLDPFEFLAALQALERAHGRRRGGERWGPRSLDLDLLVYGGRVLTEAELTVPHPRIAGRNFVLLPLVEIAPHLPVPGLASAAQLAAAVSHTEPRIERVAYSMRTNDRVVPRGHKP